MKTSINTLRQANRSQMLLYLVACGLSGFATMMGAPNDISDVAGFHKLALSSGPNFIGAPLHPAPIFRGAVDAVSVDMLSFAVSPGWSANQFAVADGNAQFLALLYRATVGSQSKEGEWWPVTSNNADTLWLNTGGEDLAEFITAGDMIEIRRLTSLKDLFGTGATLRLNEDSDGSANPLDEDVIYFVSGTGFSNEAFYHDGSLAPEGYYVDGNGPFDGSTLTLRPDEPVMVFRKTGAPHLTLISAGYVHATRLTHYLQPGPNSVTTGFAVDSPVGSSGLTEAGWKADSDGSPSPADEDVLYTVVGSSFAEVVFLHDGSLAPAGWYANGSPAETFPLQSGKGLIVFVQNPAGLRWRQNVPF